MMERFKSALLVFLVVLSLLQTYLLAYRMPWLGTTTRSDQDYVNTELIGKVSNVESVIYPEELILHLGEDKHTIVYPNTQFYDLIVRQRLANRELKGLQLVANKATDWTQLKRDHQGIELSFRNGISFDLLKKLLKIEADALHAATQIDRIYIYAVKESEEVHAFFFEKNGSTVYEAVRVDLTVKDLQDYVGFGEYLPRYEYLKEHLYVAIDPIQATEYSFGYDVITPEQMQRSLFFDYSTTRAIVNRSGSQIYTDGKRGLKVEQNGLWISYSNSTASQTNTAPASENVYVAVDFVNQHGGWDSSYQLANVPEADEKYIRFRKYIEQYPVIDISPFNYGYIQLGFQQGVVVEYERTLITLPSVAESKTIRWLFGGTGLRSQLESYSNKDKVVAIFPALTAVPQSDNQVKFIPVWAVQLQDGTEEVLMDAMLPGIDPDILDRSK
ncbi:MAG TPA: YycH family regulatory protein [Candidatus Paenibacillus intestinavium]|nr:YycH family regulatory protein [Candidatus Paenibacillus intestinavium]